MFYRVNQISRRSHRVHANPGDRIRWRPERAPLGDWRPSGYVSWNGSAWRFRYSTVDLDPESGNNIRVWGYLVRRNYEVTAESVLRLTVSGEIETINAETYDLLDFVVDTVDDSEWDGVQFGTENYNMEHDADPSRVLLDTYNPTDYTGERLDLLGYVKSPTVYEYNLGELLAPGTYNLRFVWDTMDERFQAFDGWTITDMTLDGVPAVP